MLLRTKLALLFVITLVSLLALDYSFNLMTQKSDGAFFIGALGILGLFIVYPTVFWKFLKPEFRKLVRYFKENK